MLYSDILYHSQLCTESSIVIRMNYFYKNHLICVKHKYLTHLQNTKRLKVYC